MVVEDEMPSELIEGASQAVDDVPENHGRAALSFIGHYRNPKDVITLIRIELGAHLERVAFPVADRSDLAFESMAMLPRPLNLRPNSAEVDGDSCLQKRGELT